MALSLSEMRERSTVGLISPVFLFCFQILFRWTEITLNHIFLSFSCTMRRVNAFGKEAILIPIHCNAMGSGVEWMPANGWSVFVGNNASMNSKRLARQLAHVALNGNVKVRRPSPQDLYWTANLYICQQTNCPAVLLSLAII